MKIKGINVFVSDDKKRVVIKHPRPMPRNQSDAIVKYLIDEDFIDNPLIKVFLVRN